MWVRDFHVDGLRLDAVQRSTISARGTSWPRSKPPCSDEAARQSRLVHVIAESNQNDVRLVRPRERGGYGLDGVWSDDFHHSVHALLTGERDGYYLDFGRPEQLAKALNDVFVYDGCYSPFRRRRHGSRVGATRPHAIRRLRAEPRPGGKSRRRRPLGHARCRRPRSGWRAVCCCSRRACRCCSWARNTASSGRFPSSARSAIRR